MKTQTQNEKATSSHAIANQTIQKKRDNKSLQRISDNRPEAITQRKQQSAITESTNEPIQTKTNNTGLPNNLKSGIENLSGYGMDDVKVHYNSAKPSQLQAYAYTQGSNIHVAPGQEKHLPHEAWHVVQQKQGRVSPTRQLKGININDNVGLEKEADVMGRVGEKAPYGQTSNIISRKSRTGNTIVQRITKSELQGGNDMKLRNLFSDLMRIGPDIGKIRQVANHYNIVGEDSSVKRQVQMKISELEEKSDFEALYNVIKVPRREGTSTRTGGRNTSNRNLTQANRGKKPKDEKKEIKLVQRPSTARDPRFANRERDLKKTKIECQNMEDIELFPEQISYEHVRQGRLGDCWFISVLAAYASTRPDYLKSDVVKDSHIGEDGVHRFIVNFYIDSGKKRESKAVVVSNTLASINGKLIYANKGLGSENSSLWVPIVEKAAAACLGSYEYLKGNAPIEGHKKLSKETKHIKLGGAKIKVIEETFRMLKEKKYPATICRRDKNEKKSDHAIAVIDYNNGTVTMFNQATGKTFDRTIGELVNGTKNYTYPTLAYSILPEQLALEAEKDETAVSEVIGSEVIEEYQ